MNKLCIGILFATAIAWAGIGVVNFPYGEKSGGPDACRAIQLNVQGVSPANGTVSIGEITAKWEAEDKYIVVFGFDYSAYYRLDYNADDDEYWNMEYGVTVQKSDEQTPGLAQYWLQDRSGAMGYKSYFFANTEDPLLEIVPGNNYTLTGWSNSESQPEKTGETITLHVRADIVPRATTNALWTVTAAGGNATNNLPDYTFLRFAGHDYVRYGTATGGVVNLFVED